MLLLPALAYPQDRQPTLNLALFTLATQTMVDYSITTYALKTGDFIEANPLASWYVSNPHISVPIILGVTYLTSKVLLSIGRDNKTLALIIAGTLILARGLIIYHNLHLIHKYS